MENNSITNFDYKEVRDIDIDLCKTIKDDMLLKILVVRGVDYLNPTLRFGALKLLKQLNGEKIEDEIKKEDNFQKVEYRKNNQFKKDLNYDSKRNYNNNDWKYDESYKKKENEYISEDGISFKNTNHYTKK